MLQRLRVVLSLGMHHPDVVLPQIREVLSWETPLVLVS